jgi:hypothetical protein
MNVQESVAALRADFAPGGIFYERGVHYEPGAPVPRAYVSSNPDRGASLSLAMDALPPLQSDPNSGVPMQFLNYVDPQVYEFLFAPLLVAEALGGELQRGDWTSVSAMFPVVEATGEVSSYEDYSNSGLSGVNMNWPQRENYIFQTIIPYGELEVARAGAAKINIVAEKEKSAAGNLNRFLNFMYAFGVNGLDNWGSLNDPNLTAFLTPALKSYGGTSWNSGGVTRASANEIFTDFQTSISQLITQGGGTITPETPMVAILGSTISNALATINAFGLGVRDMLKREYPALKVVSGVTQYNALSSQNSQGVAAGNVLQIWAPEVQGQRAALPAYSEKMRTHPIIRELSAFRQKRTAGAWGTVIRMPFAAAQMVGI